MNNITRVGVDLAKNVIQECAVDVTGKFVPNKPLQRAKFLTRCADLPKGG